MTTCLHCTLRVLYDIFEQIYLDRKLSSVETRNNMELD